MLDLSQVKLNPEVLDWLDKETGVKNTEVVPAGTAKAVETEVTARKDGKPYGLLAFARTDSLWWGEFVGRHNKHVFFVQGRLNGASSVGLALIAFNVTEQDEVVSEKKEKSLSRFEHTEPEQIHVDNSKVPEANVSITQLLNMGMSYNGIAQELGISPMKVARTHKRVNTIYLDRIETNHALSKLVNEKEKILRDRQKKAGKNA